MKHYLITANAGTVKSSVCKVLQKMGYEAYDLEDIPGLFAMYRKDTGKLYEGFENGNPEHIANAEWFLNSEALKALFANQKKDIAFYCGVGSNTIKTLSFFDKVFLLVASKETLYKRLSNREGKNDMGGNEAGRQAVLGWKDWWEHEMRKQDVVEIDAEGTPREVAEEIIKHI